MRDVVIIGGGLSGLAAAWELETLKIPYTLIEVKARLGGAINSERALLIVDDVWKIEHAALFRLGVAGCAMIITTRLNDVAQALTPTPGTQTAASTPCG